MEPITLIVTALAAGATGGALDAVKEDVREKVKAAYAKVRDLARRRVAGRPHGELALVEYEGAPQKWEALLAAELGGDGPYGEGTAACHRDAGHGRCRREDALPQKNASE